MDQTWKTVKDTAIYCDVSPRTVRMWIKELELKHVRVRGILLIKLEWIDSFLESFMEDHTKENEIDQLVNEVVGDL